MDNARCVCCNQTDQIYISRVYRRCCILWPPFVRVEYIPLTKGWFTRDTHTKMKGKRDESEKFPICGGHHYFIDSFSFSTRQTIAVCILRMHVTNKKSQKLSWFYVNLAEWYSNLFNSWLKLLRQLGNIHTGIKGKRKERKYSLTFFFLMPRADELNFPWCLDEAASQHFFANHERIRFVWGAQWSRTPFSFDFETNKTKQVIIKHKNVSSFVTSFSRHTL